ncbi:MAG: L-seryl-tRNA(Sec) selenium transferase [Helicobacteraceae bacterium]|jgi:L-seryl-tRNA(Ser) seleniumtransferase|nr:L-seryl-tRNA(Sec) selenium transferase [Helicobacteraceae bacterium]
MPSLREIPKVDRLGERDELREIPPKLRSKLIRQVLDDIRAKLRDKREVSFCEDSIAKLVLRRFESLFVPSLRPLINATGVVAHTNLGRSPISQATLEEIAPVLTNYGNLEYDQEEGKRGDRYERLERLMREALGAEATLVVNNNAAAVLLILSAFARDKEAIVSRGELIEIGGGFRIPDTMRLSGAILREVGATNITRLSDYENAINENTSVIMKAHKSNFYVKGFTSEVDYGELIALARSRNLIDYFDLGGGQFAQLGLGGEPLLSEIAALNPSLVSFSGDKLFGAAQAGVIIGKKTLIDQLKQNQLLRALRVDKYAIAVLEATLRRYLLGREDEIPTVKMIKTDAEELTRRAKRLQKLLAGVKTSIEITKNFAGAGAAPSEELIGVAVVFDQDVKNMQARLRSLGVVARAEKERLYLETRTIFENQLPQVAAAVKKALE